MLPLPQGYTPLTKGQRAAQEARLAEARKTQFRYEEKVAIQETSHTCRNSDYRLCEPCRDGIPVPPEGESYDEWHARQCKICRSKLCDECLYTEV